MWVTCVDAIHSFMVDTTHISVLSKYSEMNAKINFYVSEVVANEVKFNNMTATNCFYEFIIIC